MNRSFQLTIHMSDYTALQRIALLAMIIEGDVGENSFADGENILREVSWVLERAIESNSDVLYYPLDEEEKRILTSISNWAINFRDRSG